MLRPVPMVHLRIQAPNRDAAAVTRAIASEGLLHLVDLAHGRVAADAAPPGAREQLAAYRDLSRRIERLVARCGWPLPEAAGELPASEGLDFAAEHELLERTLAPIEQSLDAKWRRRAEAAERARRAREGADRLARLRRADVDPERVASLRMLCLRFGLLAPEEISTLGSLLSPAAFAIVPLETAGDAPSLVGVAVGGADRARLDEAVRVVAFAPLPIAADPADRDPERLEREEKEALEQEARLSGEIASDGERVRGELADLARRARIGVLLLGAETLFAAAGRFVVVSGWVPEEGAAKMRRTLAERFGDRVVVEIERPDDLPEVAAGTLRVPILHRNPVLLRPFQKLVEIYGTPSYGEVEPTAFFAASFLLMFGLMFGDVGHGLVLFVAGYCLFRWIPRYLDYGILLMEAGVVSTVFGFLYGSFFGIEGALPVLWMEPLRDLPKFLTVAVGLGVLLVSAGLILNIVNTWRSGQHAAALFGTRGLFGAFGYWVLAALGIRAFLSRSFRLPAWAVLALLAVPVLLLLFRRSLVDRLERKRGPRRHGSAESPGWLGALEACVELVDSIVSYFANTISFLRVAAFALVHAGAFLALFALADTLNRVRGGGALTPVLLVAGNALIILLEGLTVSVQVLRLEYYEFFGKFFRGGGEPYRPLMLRAGVAKGVAR